jgi:hypothetical protein
MPIFQGFPAKSDGSDSVFNFLAENKVLKKLEDIDKRL